MIQSYIDVSFLQLFSLCLEDFVLLICQLSKYLGLNKKFKAVLCDVILLIKH